MLRYVFIIAAIASLISNNTAQKNPFNKIKYEGEEYFVYPEKQEVSDEIIQNEIYWEFGNIEGNDIEMLRSKHENAKLDGNWIMLFDAPLIRPAAIFSVKNNKLDGVYTSYFYSGTIHVRAMYSGGMQTGTWNYFSVDGKPQMTENYFIIKFGNNECIQEAVGEWKSWRENGNLREVKYYDSSGHRDSVWTLYFKNGNKRTEEKFCNGYMNGANRYYYVDGNVKSEFIYYRDSSINNGFIYYPTGEKMGTGSLYTYVKTGKWKYFYQNGNPKAEGEYKTFVTQRCRSSVPVDFLHSAKNGRWTYWYEDGSVMAYGDYTCEKTGDGWGKYYVSKKTPGWKFFDKDGNITDEDYFKKNGIDIMDKDDCFLRLEEE